ncbi:BT4734/BF3469 family protein [Sediminitomix flava]|uniref:VirE-like protein n=1 Tax=Sediminitomix flava TaxID=379075 RepID=A0A315Z9Q1_SEDFL|nr:BT4734/BF3469 family protein [Sediminitomix flava]PWJ42251.1 VirE-like protein [Sediminitomix flava]
MKLYKTDKGVIIGENGYPINWDFNPIQEGLFSYFKGGITITYPYRSITIIQLYEVISGKYHQKVTDTYRLKKDSNIKRRMDYVTFSGVFSKRSEKGIISQSGYICFDFDHVQQLDATKATLINNNDFQTVLLFKSPSGDGLKWVVEVDLNKHHQLVYFVAISNYLQQKYNLTVDKACKDLSRACFIPHDPECFIHPKFFQL